jgi:ribosomal protein S3
MSQKTTSISLRLNKKNNWESKWILNKEEYSILFYLDLEIKKYFLKFLNNKEFDIIKINIKKISKNINIYLYLNHKKIIKKSSFKYQNYKKILNCLNNFYFNFHFKIFIRRIRIKKNLLLKKNISKIFNFVKKKNFINYYNKQMIYNFFFGFYIKNLNIILIVIKKILEKKKKHKKFLKNINNMIEIFFKIFYNILGYKLQFKGRLNSYKRKKKIIYKKGKIPLNTLKYNIKYNFDEFLTPSGICSIKLWIFFKN